LAIGPQISSSLSSNPNSIADLDPSNVLAGADYDADDFVANAACCAFVSTRILG
jgi:hypothetical protein